jgi:hypothetical protein
MGELSSRKQQREQLVGSLRAEGKSWVEVAEALRERYRFNARVALRYAHGWSQREAADEWNKRWPDELKTFKMFSYWEMWPGTTGHAPSFDNLSKLAELYECAVSDLLADLPDFRHRDTNSTTRTTASEPAAENVVPSDPSLDYLVRFLSSWAKDMERRKVLRALGWTATAVAAAPVLKAIDPDEQKRVIAACAEPGRVDMQTIQHIEEVLWSCKRQDDTLGPQAALDTVLAQRNLARSLERDCSASLRLRLLSVLGNASRQAGWLYFDLNDFASAGYYYDDARTLAHEAEEAEPGAYVLCLMSQMATWQHKPRMDIDYAVAAGEWAKRTDDVLLQAYAADVAARAYAANGQLDACRGALDAAQAALALSAGTDRRSRFIYFYDDSTHASTRSLCYLRTPGQAVSGVDDQARRALEEPGEGSGQACHYHVRRRWHCPVQVPCCRTG